MNKFIVGLCMTLSGVILMGCLFKALDKSDHMTDTNDNNTDRTTTNVNDNKSNNTIEERLSRLERKECRSRSSYYDKPKKKKDDDDYWDSWNLLNGP